MSRGPKLGQSLIAAKTTMAVKSHLLVFPTLHPNFHVRRDTIRQYAGQRVLQINYRNTRLSAKECLRSAPLCGGASRRAPAGGARCHALKAALGARGPEAVRTRHQARFFTGSAHLALRSSLGAPGCCEEPNQHKVAPSRNANGGPCGHSRIKGGDVDLHGLVWVPLR